MELVEQKNQELRNAMDQLHQGHKRAVAAQRLAYAGHLAAGMAHECNNPLAIPRAGNWVLTMTLRLRGGIVIVDASLRSNSLRTIWPAVASPGPVFHGRLPRGLTPIRLLGW